MQTIQLNLFFRSKNKTNLLIQICCIKIVFNLYSKRDLYQLTNLDHTLIYFTHLFDRIPNITDQIINFKLFNWHINKAFVNYSNYSNRISSNFELSIIELLNKNLIKVNLTFFFDSILKFETSNTMFELNIILKFRTDKP